MPSIVMKRIACSIFFLASFISTFSQWQQRVKYTMNVVLDVNSNIITGKQVIDYWNNSPDTLKRVYFHLYWNAFQPNSSMDVRSRELGKLVSRHDKKGQPILDWDKRIKDT